MANYDVDVPRLALVGLLGAIGTATVVVALQVVYYRYEAGRERSERYIEPPRKLEALREAQGTRLTDYGVIDGEKGIVAIPINRAMGLVIDELAVETPDSGATQEPEKGGDDES